MNQVVGQGKGSRKGSAAIRIPETGEYVFDVEADGRWQIDVVWPTPETAPVSEVPFTASGTGDQAVYFVLVQTGSHTLTMTHDGVGNFSVMPMTSEGRRYIDTLRGTGASMVSQEFTIRDHAFEFLMLNIRTNANWTVRIE